MFIYLTTYDQKKELYKYMNAYLAGRKIYEGYQFCEFLKLEFLQRKYKIFLNCNDDKRYYDTNNSTATSYQSEWAKQHYDTRFNEDD